MAVLVPAEGQFLQQVLAATYEIWHDGLSRPAYDQFYAAQLKTAWGRRHLQRWALVEGGDVLASAKTYRFDAVLDGRPLSIVGLGAVFTQPAHRRRGHARELLERLLERAEADGVGAALLFSAIGVDFYGRLGFVPIPTTELDLRVVESARGAPATLVRAGDERDLDAIAAIGRVRAQGYRFHLDRDRDLIQYSIARNRLLAGLGSPGAFELQFFVAEEGGSAVAYVVLMTSGPEQHDAAKRGWVLEECGDRDPSGARVGAILQVLAAREPAEARPRIRAWLPTGFRPPQIVVVSEEPAGDARGRESTLEAERQRQVSKRAEVGPRAEVEMMIRPLAARIAPPLAKDDVLYWHGDFF